MADVTQWAMYGLGILLVGYMIVTGWRSSLQYVTDRGDMIGLSPRWQTFWQAVTRVLGPVGWGVFTLFHGGDGSTAVGNTPALPFFGKLSNEDKTFAGTTHSDEMTLAPEVEMALVVTQTTAKKGPKVGTTYPLFSGLVSIGRAKPSQAERALQISNDPSVSSHHMDLRISLDGSAVTITDLSRFGTWVNGERLEPDVDTNIKVGDEIKAGHTTLRLVTRTGDGMEPILQVMVPPVYQFTVISGPDKGNVFKLEGQSLKLGRRYGLTEKTVSNEHAEIRREGDQLKLQNLSKTHGTAVNGRTLTHTVLNEGDLLKLGPHTEIKVEKLAV